MSAASSTIARPLMLLLAVYVVLPLGNLPGLHVSLSAPLFALLIVEAAASTQWRLRGRWAYWAAAIWAGCLLSLGANVLSGRLAAIESDEALLLARFAYWMLVFVVTAAILARAEWAPQVAVALGVGAAALAGLRLAEGALTGVWGGGNPRWLSQNDYGFGFSAFLPFLFWLAVSRRGPARWAAGLAAGAAWIAVAGNGSRSSWIAALLAALVLGTLLLMAGRFRVGLAAAFVACISTAALAVAVVPAAADSPLRRWRTLTALEHDKPFQTRLLLIEKGRRLFLESPLFGVGLGRFSKETVPVDGLSEAPWLTGDELNRRTPHNAYIKALAETGLAGAAPLAGLFLLLAVRAVPAAVRLTRRGESWAAAAVAAAAGMSVHLWTMSGLTGTGPWFLLGLAAAVIERDRERRGVPCT